jgi:hypothetical protein
MNPEECSFQPFRGGSLKPRNVPILLSNATFWMSAAIRRKTLSIYCMVCRFEQVVYCEVQYTDVTPTLEFNLSNLMFVPCIAGLCIENQHCALGFVNVFITNAATTCFGTYVPSSGSVFVLVST